VNFKVNGTFNGDPAQVLFRMEDRTEPASVGDSIRIELRVGEVKIYDTHGGDFPDAGWNNAGSARTKTDRGKLQIDIR
jgi:hypothetical protein